jgi:hypothetical protein
MFIKLGDPRNPKVINLNQVRYFFDNNNQVYAKIDDQSYPTGWEWDGDGAIKQLRKYGLVVEEVKRP